MAFRKIAEDVCVGFGIGALLEDGFIAGALGLHDVAASHPVDEGVPPVHCFHQFHTQTQKGIVPAVVCQLVGEDDFPVAFRPVVPTDRNENRFPENPCGDRAEESFESADGNPFDGFEMD